MVRSPELASLSAQNASLTSPESNCTELICFVWYILMTYIKTQGQRQRKKVNSPPIVHVFLIWYTQTSHLSQEKQRFYFQHSTNNKVLNYTASGTVKVLLLYIYIF